MAIQVLLESVGPRKVWWDDPAVKTNRSYQELHLGLSSGSKIFNFLSANFWVASGRAATVGLQHSAAQLGQPSLLRSLSENSLIKGPKDCLSLDVEFKRADLV